jgi:hypothetical protein
MKEWVEVIRDASFFNLLVGNTESVDTELSVFIDTRSKGFTVDYDSVFPVCKSNMPNPPAFIAVSDAYSHATTDSSMNNIIPHASEPAPAQRAGNVAFIWGDRSTYHNGIFPYREDGFPAVVVAVGLSKHYHYGKLNRKRQHPAIKAEYLAALWYSKQGGMCRGNGPRSITFENYKEFWIDGEFKGHRWTDYNLSWRHRLLDTPDDEDTLGDFLGNLIGTTNMFSDVYFTDGQDEVCYLTDFA